jgi:hypothetical protein
MEYQGIKRRGGTEGREAFGKKEQKKIEYGVMEVVIEDKNQQFWLLGPRF